MHACITKYALTRGIEERPAFEPAGVFAVDASYKGQFIRVRSDTFGGTLLELGRDCFWDRGKALVRAEEMRVAKIARLEKEIARLKTLRFE